MKKVIERIKARIPSYKKRMHRISFDIAAQVYEYMKAKNMNQKELAKKLKKQESEISKWLNGGHNFTIETVAKLEEVFGKEILLVPLYAMKDLSIKPYLKVIEMDEKDPGKENRNVGAVADASI